jgi:hypothetical protein
MNTSPDIIPAQPTPDLTPREQARDRALGYYTTEFYLTGPDTRTDEQRAAHIETNARGMETAKTVLAEAKAKRES